MEIGAHGAHAALAVELKHAARQMPVDYKTVHLPVGQIRIILVGMWPVAGLYGVPAALGAALGRRTELVQILLLLVVERLV